MARLGHFGSGHSVPTILLAWRATCLGYPEAFAEVVRLVVRGRGGAVSSVEEVGQPIGPRNPERAADCVRQYTPQCADRAACASGRRT
jgi:hypothetical protein